MQRYHPWHDVSIGKEAPHIVNSIIEISKGQRAKYELCKESGLLRLDRVLYSPFFYPANYGLIPRTLGEDNDPLDIFVLSQINIVPLCIVRAKIIGVLHMIDNNEGDDKIIAVAEDDISVRHINEIEELPQSFRLEIQHFFEEYKSLENKKVLVKEMGSSKEAKAILEKSSAQYQQTFKQ